MKLWNYGIVELWKCGNDLGLIPLRYIAKARRLMFLHYILNEDENSLIFKFFQAQIQNPLPGDWVLTVEQDLHILNLNFNLQSIKCLTKES